MKYKKLILSLQHKHQEKSLIKLKKDYNDVECYLEEDETIQTSNMELLYSMKITKSLKTIEVRL